MTVNTKSLFWSALALGAVLGLAPTARAWYRLEHASICTPYVYTGLTGQTLTSAWSPSGTDSNGHIGKWGFISGVNATETLNCPFVSEEGVIAEGTNAIVTAPSHFTANTIYVDVADCNTNAQITVFACVHDFSSTTMSCGTSSVSGVGTTGFVTLTPGLAAWTANEYWYPYVEVTLPAPDSGHVGGGACTGSGGTSGIIGITVGG